MKGAAFMWWGDAIAYANVRAATTGKRQRVITIPGLPLWRVCEVGA